MNFPNETATNSLLGLNIGGINWRQKFKYYIEKTKLADIKLDFENEFDKHSQITFKDSGVSDTDLQTQAWVNSHDPGNLVGDQILSIIGELDSIKNCIELFCDNLAGPYADPLAIVELEFLFDNKLNRYLSSEHGSKLKQVKQEFGTDITFDKIVDLEKKLTQISTRIKGTQELISTCVVSLLDKFKN